MCFAFWSTNTWEKGSSSNWMIGRACGGKCLCQMFSLTNSPWASGRSGSAWWWARWLQRWRTCTRGCPCFPSPRTWAPSPCRSRRAAPSSSCRGSHFKQLLAEPPRQRCMWIFPGLHCLHLEIATPDVERGEELSLQAVSFGNETAVCCRLDWVKISHCRHDRISLLDGSTHRISTGVRMLNAYARESSAVLWGERTCLETLSRTVVAIPVYLAAFSLQLLTSTTWVTLSSLVSLFMSVA